MLLSLVAWIYISIVCLIWGYMFLSAITPTNAAAVIPSLAGIIPPPGNTIPPPVVIPPSFNLSLICLAGLAVISTLALLLSLFMPLDWKAHCLILLPAVIYCAKQSHRRSIRTLVTTTTGSLSATGICLLFVCIGMILIISSFHITHPDTMVYHARSILLFERYKAIPGIANLRDQLGFQSGWFASLALFKTSLPRFYNIIFLNGAVLCWYFLFIAQKISASFSPFPGNTGNPVNPSGNRTSGWAWLLLLSYTLFSWTQIRLTAASASPDFIVSLYSWAAIYAFIQKEDKVASQSIWLSLVVLFCLAAILTKLSSIALLPLAIIAITRSFRLRSAKTLIGPAKVLIGYSCLAMLFLFLRNRMASGYLLYPFSRPDIFDLPWKMSGAAITNLQHYIALYARFPIDSADMAIYWKTPFPQWVPRWWDQFDFIDRLLLLGILAGLVANGIFALRKRYSLVLLITLAGSLLWLLGAPALRFGTGVLVPLLFFLYQRLPLPRKIPALLLATGCLLVTIAAYTVYRAVYFSAPSQLLVPAGIFKQAYEPLGCDNISVDLLNDKMEIKGKTGRISCTDPPEGFSPIGTTIAEGFKPPPD